MSNPTNFTSNPTGVAHSHTARRPWTRMILTLVTLLALLTIAQPYSGHAAGQLPWTPVGGTITPINTGPGEQVDAHASGNLVVYTNMLTGTAEIRSYDLLTGLDTAIPSGGGLDYLPDIEGSMVAYTHLWGDGSTSAYAINVFDTSTGQPPVTLDPQPGSQREKPAIGGQTVVWLDYEVQPTHEPELMVYDLATGSTTRLTNDLFYDTDPEISPDGSMIVWTKCTSFGQNCRIWQATRSNDTWAAEQLAGDGYRATPVVDDRFIVYVGVEAEDVDIYWRERGSSEEHRLALPGNQHLPALSNGLVAFASMNLADPIPNWDILLYDLSTGAGYQVTDSIASEHMPTITVTPDGLVHIVWSGDAGTPAWHLYTRSFSLPSGDTTAPSISITAPGETTYALNETVLADYTCSDETGGSGLASCDGPITSGAAIDTVATGAKTFTVTAADLAGNSASQSVSYTVTNNICVLYDQGKSHKIGSTVPLKLQLCDANGASVSTADIVVHATGLTQVDTSASTSLDTTSNANPDNDFRYDASLGGYIYNLGTGGLSAGTWRLEFTVTGDPLPHSVQFDLR